MKSTSKLTLITSIVVAAAIAGHGYHTIMKRKNILASGLKREVRAIARTAKIAIEEAPTWHEEDLRGLVRDLGRSEKTLGVFVQLNKSTLQSTALEEVGQSFESNLRFSKRTVARGEAIERFSRYGEIPVYVYFEPLRGNGGRAIGSIGIIQHASLLKKDIWITRLAGGVTMILLFGLITASTAVAIRYNVRRRLSDLIDRFRQARRGEFDVEVPVTREDELGELAKELNQMAVSLGNAERRASEEHGRNVELEQRMRHLERLATIGQLASGLAHEIGTPLNVIGGRANYMKRRLVDKDLMEKNLDIIERQSQRISKIIRRLLDFSRRNSDHFVRTEISAAIDSVLELLSYRIRKQGIEVVRTFSSDLPWIEGDPEQLQQVLLNLVYNAVQAMPNGGELVLRADHLMHEPGEGPDNGQHSVEIQICDTGCGMKPETLKHIFTPFFTTKENGRGTGLGLAIAHGIIRDHGGTIRVLSDVGKGTTVRISLPAETTHASGRETMDPQ